MSYEIRIVNLKKYKIQLSDKFIFMCANFFIKKEKQLLDEYYKSMKEK
jgi:hypothetical protein